jgi:hypothetical protein
MAHPHTLCPQVEPGVKLVLNDVSCSMSYSAHLKTGLTCGSSREGGTAEAQGRGWHIACASTGLFSG